MDDKPQPVALQTPYLGVALRTPFLEVVTALKERFAAQDTEFRGELTLTLAPQYIVKACLALRDEFGFDMLIGETAVDYWPAQTPRFHLVYHIYSMAHNAMICLRVPLDGSASHPDFGGNAPHATTVEKVYPGANWHEREIYDMFGIIFDGHSDLRRIIMPHDWEGHPLRKDYPLGYEEVQFSFNAEEIGRRKPYPKE
jgi:NADH-quinone oxidoreductase subunit C